MALLQVWKNFEEQRGTQEDVDRVQGMMPVQGKRRYVDEETGQLVEDYDYIFADDERESNPTSFKFLQMAHAWKSSGGSGLLSGFTAPNVNADNDSSEEESDEDDEKSSDAGDDEPMEQDKESVASSKGDD